MEVVVVVKRVAMLGLITWHARYTRFARFVARGDANKTNF